MGENIYSPGEKLRHWVIFGVMLSMVPVILGIFLDFIRLDYDLHAACEAHLFDFVLMVFAISGGLIEMSFDLEREMNAKVRHVYNGWSLVLGFLCLAIFEPFYLSQSNLPINAKSWIFVTALIICFACFVLGWRILYVDSTQKTQSNISQNSQN